MTETRRPQILDACAISIQQFGWEGATLERIAAIADMKRSILRHYVGNRDNLMREAAQRILDTFRGWLKSDLAAAPQPRALIDQLFPVAIDNQSIPLRAFAGLAVEAKVAAAAPVIAEGVAEFRRCITELLRAWSRGGARNGDHTADALLSLAVSRFALEPATGSGVTSYRETAFNLLEFRGIEVDFTPDTEELIPAEEATEIGLND